MMMIAEEDRPDFEIYLFINTQSGGKAGKRFMTLEIESVRFNLNKQTIDCHIADLNEIKSRINGMRKLRHSQNIRFSRSDPRVIVCGGDGTVLWVVEELVKQGIDVHGTAIGVVPIGTGNDLSRVLGWGGEQTKMIGNKLEKLKSLVLKWVSAEIHDLDIWDVELTTYQNGYFKQNVNGVSTIIPSMKSFRRAFCNYCSIGVDGRIGYSFDKWRSASRALNLAIYATLGLLKCLKPIIKLEDLIVKMQGYANYDSYIRQIKTIQDSNVLPLHSTQNILPLKESSPENDSKSLVNLPHLSAKKVQILGKKLASDPAACRLKPGFGNLLALNLNSFMGGASNIWAEASEIGVKQCKQNFIPQSQNDGVLEFISWKGEIGLALERIVGMGSRIAQGPGPFTITFEESDKPDYHTYFQVDGEYYKVYHPNTMQFKKSQLVPNGSIRVLKNVSD